MFTDKLNTVPASTLNAFDPLHTVWVRTTAGVRRWQARDDAHAVRMTAEAFPDETVIGTVDPEIEVNAEQDGIRVAYYWDGEGRDGEWDSEDPDDLPLMRVSVSLNRGGQFEEVGSWCTANSTIVEPDVLRVRAQDAARTLAHRVRLGEDPDAVAGSFLRQNRDATDPLITKPVTAEMIAKSYPERTERGEVIGYYVVDRESGEPLGAPRTHQDEADAVAGHLNDVLNDYDVVCGYVLTADGKVVVG